MLPQHVSNVALIRQRALTKGVAWEYTAHAEREMADDGIERPDVRNALANCRSVKAQVIDGETRYRATGKDTEGRTITVVVELYETALRICVVTAWKGDRK
jgi:uncharacterized DUF497 family protein